MTPFQEAIRETLKAMAPPTALTVSEWADQFRMLSAESSAEPGPWDTSRAPYQKGMMDAFSDPEVEEIVNMTSSQIGKNEIMNNMIGYAIHKDPAPMLFISPIDTIAQTISRDRIAPMIRDTKVLTELFTDPSKRTGDNAVLHKSFRGGHITLAGANSPSNLASRPIKNLFLDEEDRYPASAGDEGDPANLAKKRTSTYWNRKIVKSSTPDNEDTSRIEPDFQRSNQQYFYVPCPKCKKKQRLEWKNVKWDKLEGVEGLQKHKPETARIECSYCQYGMVDADLMEMLEGGEWRATYKDRKVYGFHINELYSPWVTLEETVVPFLEATYKRDRELLKVWTNTSLGETFKESGESTKKEGLEARVEDYGEGVDIPDGVLLLTAAIDVQDDRLEMEVMGWGLDGENWGIEYNVVHGDTAQSQVWQDAYEWVTAPRFRASGVEMNVRTCCVDSGGHRTQEVYQFCKKYESRRFKAIKGKGGQGIPFIRDPTANNNLKCKVYTLGVDGEKANLLLSNLKLDTPGPNYSHFPMGRGYTTEDEAGDNCYFKQLVSEERKIKFVQGKKFYYWVKRKGHRRNEALDLRVYNKAARDLSKPMWKALKKNIEQKDKDFNPEKPTQKTSDPIPRVRTPRRGFAKNF